MHHNRMAKIKKTTVHVGEVIGQLELFYVASGSVNWLQPP